jgi:hypothetical protein
MDLLKGEFVYCRKRYAAFTVNGNYTNGIMAEMVWDITGEGIK